MFDSYRPVRRQEKLSVQVADQLIDLILEGKLKEGDRLPPEREMCETFGVSRTVIREAVSVVEAKGLVSSLIGSGTYVRAVQREDVVSSLGLYMSTMSKSISMMHVLEVRWVIETQTVLFAAERATEEDIAELEELLADMQGLVHDPVACSQKDLEFHLRLARASGNPLFEIVLQPLTEVLQELIYVGSRLPGITEQAYTHHRAILDAIKTHDVAKAAAAMENHLRQTERVTIRGLREKGREQQDADSQAS